MRSSSDSGCFLKRPIAHHHALIFFVHDLAGACVLIFCLIAFADFAPFDVVEAESELMDGLGTETGGYIFSIFYAGEVALLLF